MGKITDLHHIRLIINRRFILSLFLVLYGMGSYTYSEGSKALHPLSSLKQNSLVTISSSFSGIECFSLKPAVIPLAKSQPEKKTKTYQSPSELIMDKGLISAKHLADFLTTNNKSIEYNYAIKLAKLYINEASHEGVNPDIAFTQMCLETGFLRFDGTVSPSQNNFCGLGVTGNGIKGLSFENEQMGIRAHIQHLKAYASLNNLNYNLIDTRFHYVKRGSVKDISGLTGSWAADKQYDKKIRNLLHRLYTMNI